MPSGKPKERNEKVKYMDIQNMVAEMVEKEIENGAKLRMLNISFGAVNAYIAFEKDGKLCAYGIKTYFDYDMLEVAEIVKTESKFTVWNERIDANLFREMETVKKFYKHNDALYVETKEELNELSKKHYDRVNARRVKKEFKPNQVSREFVDKFVRTHKGWKSVNFKDIKWSKNPYGGYTVLNVKNGKTYRVEF